MAQMLFLLSAIGFNVETVQYKNLKFQVWDLGGQTSIRYLSIYFVNCKMPKNSDMEKICCNHPKI